MLGGIMEALASGGAGSASMQKGQVMETQVLEGTLTEIQRQLSDLPCAPETRVRVTIEEAGPRAATKHVRNGITLVPVKDPNRVLTTEFVKELLESE